MRPIRPHLAAAFALLASAGIALAAAPGDIKFERAQPEASEMIPVSVFSHWQHRMRFTCNVCHPALFPMKSKDVPPITMDEIKAGKACGVCHNGQGAFASSVNTCVRCHPQPVQ
jgi:c(7)-type cytochrome triheme protein